MPLFQVPIQAHQIPFATHRFQTPQLELPEAQHFFEDAITGSSVDGFFKYISFLGAGFQDRFGFCQVAQAPFAQRDLYFKMHSLQQLTLIRLFSQRYQFFHFCLQLLLKFQQVSIADGLAR